MKAFMLTFGSFMLTAGVVMNAYYQKKQFYPSVVYITKSNPSMAVLYLQAFVFVILMGKLCRKIFFGQLRPAEVEHLIERSWYAVTETCLAFTVFRDDFSSRFVALFTMLLFLKCFHWLGEDRIDYMERSPVITWSFHLRVLGLILGLAGLDLFFVHHAYYSTLIKGASVQLVFGFEYAILLTIVVTMFVKYVLHTIDLQNENPWENKAVYLLYSELFLGFIRVMLYFVFLAIMIKVHTFPLFAIRPMYLTMRAFKKALNDVIMSRRAIRNMNTLYPDATPEELASGDNVCIICREEMVNNCKKLPCSHIFHTSCMRSWFQRQQTCPTCRMDVLRPSPRPAQTQPAQQPAQPAPEPQQPQPGMPGWFPMWMPPAQQQQQQQQQQPQQQQAQGPAGSAESTATSSTTTTTPPSASPGPSSPFSPGVPPFMMPPMMMPMPFYTPMPMPSADLTNLSDEEVRAMEGYERKNVEARIQVLRNIQTLLDGAVAQMHQYSTVFNNYGESSISQQQGSAFTFPSPPQQSGGPAANTTTTSTVGSAPISSTLPPSSESSTEASKPSVNTVNGSGDADAGELEGAVGYSPPPEENIPSWHDDRFEDSDSEEVREIRRRRLERFSSLNNERTQENENSERKLKDNLELD